MKNFHEEVAEVKQLHVRITKEQAEGIRLIMMAFEDVHDVSATKQDIVSLILKRGIKSLTEEYKINTESVIMLKETGQIEMQDFANLSPKLPPTE